MSVMTEMAGELRSVVVASLSLKIVSCSDKLLQTDVCANPGEQLLEVGEPSLLGEQGGHSKKSLQVLVMGLL